MSSRNIDSKGKYDSDGDDDSKSIDSFESALCAMYNDVLCHAVIPEEEDEIIHLGRRLKDRPPAMPRKLTHASRQDSLASFRSASAHSTLSASSSTGKDESPVSSPRNKITHASRNDSFVSCRSVSGHSVMSAASNTGTDESSASPRKKITHASGNHSLVSFRSAYAPSMGSASSYMLSVGPEASEAEDDGITFTSRSVPDDDLSYITEPDFEESRHILIDLKTNQSVTKRRSSPMKNTTHERYIFGHDSERRKDVFSLTGLNVEIKSSSFSPHLTCSVVSTQGASLSSDCSDSH